MRSSKSRSRSRQNRNNNRSLGNVINRVFDSSGPEGKVRGTPQQIIEKYNQLARDAQLANDRVAAENFQQHAEHYLRLLSEAQREMDQRREQQERDNRERQAQRDKERQDRDPAAIDDDGNQLISDGFSDADDQPIVDAMPILDDDMPAHQSNHAESKSSQPDASAEADEAVEKPKKPRKPRAPRKKKAETGDADGSPQAAE